MESALSSNTPTGLRRDWMFRAAREAQIIAGVIALDRSASAEEVGTQLRCRIPRPANDLELYILEGLVASALSELRRIAFSSYRGHSRSPLASRAASVLRDRYYEDWSLQRLARE